MLNICTLGAFKGFVADVASPSIHLEVSHFFAEADAWEVESDDARQVQPPCWPLHLAAG